MPDYQKMYAVLFNKITDVIADLQVAQTLTEQLYVDSAPESQNIVEFPLGAEKNRPHE